MRKEVIQIVVMKKKKKTSSEGGSIQDRIKPVQETSLWLKMLIYGRSGTGKTTLIGTMPKPILLLDAREEGTISIRNRPDTFVLSLESWNDLEEIYWYLVNDGGLKKYKTIAVDTVTSLQDLAIKHIVGEGNISRRGWGDIASLMKTWIVNYRDLQANIVITAQDRASAGDTEDLDDEENVILPEVGPYVMPSVAKILNASVDIIGQTYIRETEKKIKVKKKGGETAVRAERIVEYCLRIGPHARYITKLRRDTSSEDGLQAPDQLIPSLVNPTYQKIYDLSINQG